jgi:tetratricopeptide (TPR) repeat protein
MRIAAGLLAALAAAAAAPAWAQANFDIDLCGSRQPQRSIAACTRVIQDRLQPADIKTTALRNRGFAHQIRGEPDAAITDYDAAIALVLAGGRSPRGEVETRLAKTYVDRGVAWREKGDVDRALADFDAAIAADPKLESAQENRDALFFRKR